MTGPLNQGNICGTSMPGVRRNALPDGDQVGLIGLDAIMEALFKKGRVPDDGTVEEMIDRLRERKICISHSQPVLELYRKARNDIEHRCHLRIRYHDERPDSPVFLEIKRRAGEELAQADATALDITDLAATAAMVAADGPFDILVNSAGLAQPPGQYRPYSAAERGRRRHRRRAHQPLRSDIVHWR